MNRKNLPFSILFILPALFSLTTAAQTKPISLHPENPHYFLYKNKPAVLITSAEHYGAVLNLDFDYIPYLDELKSKGLNLTRTFTGAYVEPAGAFNIANNTLAPVAGKFICPWLRSNETGYAGGGNKFDLTKWDVKYFKRLKDFISKAKKRGIIVELTLFCPFYEDIQWKLSPLNSINNVNGLGNIPRTDVYTLDKNKGLLTIQEVMVRKIVNELKSYDNIIYEICNEPYFGGITLEWQYHIADIITDVEKSFKRKHLISQNIANGFQKIQNPHRAVSIFNFHYATPPKTVGANYHLNKAIGDNETGFNGNSDVTYRREGWEFILAGGALYNNLDYSFTPDQENGTFHYNKTQPGGGSAQLRQQLSYLKDFISSFDFLNMQPDTSFISGKSKNIRVQALAEKGKQYAVYVFGDAQFKLELDLPEGNYKVEWMNTLNGKSEKEEVLKHTGGKVKLISPNFTEDIALKIVNEN